MKDVRKKLTVPTPCPQNVRTVSTPHSPCGQHHGYFRSVSGKAFGVLIDRSKSSKPCFSFLKLCNSAGTALRSTSFSTVYAFLRVCFIYLLFYRCNSHATTFKSNLNSFHVHVLTYIVLPLSPFFVHCCQIYFLCMLIWAKND